ncbi:MAG TPA: MFS transporter [Gaiellaceae bacterium]|nr:MFS transporter [Gaiellaceae bacterium]
MRPPSLRPRSELWRDAGFVRLFVANATAQLGEQVSLIAIPLAALYVLKASALGVALLRSFAVLPFLLFALPAGVWVDRLRRRPLMILADFGRAAAVVSIPVAYWLGHLSMAQLYLVAGVHGFLSVLFDLAYLSFLPTLVGRDHLGEANEKLLGMQSAAGLAGPTLAGGLVAAVGAPVAVLAEAVGFFASGSVVLAIRGREEWPEPTQTRARAELTEGLRYVFSQPYLRTLTIWISAGNLFTSALFALLIVYLVRDLHFGATTIGWVSSVIGLGFVGAAFTNGRLVRRFGVGPMIAYTGLASQVLLLGLPLAPTASPLPLLLVAGVGSTFLGFFMNVNQLTLRQAITPNRLLGRMNAVTRFMYWGTMPLGSALGGVVANAAGLRATLVAACVGAIVTQIPIAISPIRKLRGLPSPPPEPALTVEPLALVRSTVSGDAGAAGDGGVASPAH